MTIERFLLIAMVIVSTSTFLYIPKGQFRKALLAFLVFQATTWFVSIVLVQTETVEFPMREFTKATKVVFTTEFFYYPMIFQWFIFLFPKLKGRVFQMLHWFLFISLSSWSAYFLGKYTGLSEFLKENEILYIFNTYWLFTLQYLVCYLFISWYFKQSPEEENNRCITRKDL